VAGDGTGYWLAPSAIEPITYTTNRKNLDSLPPARENVGGIIVTVWFGFDVMVYVSDFLIFWATPTVSLSVTPCHSLSLSHHSTVSIQLYLSFAQADLQSCGRRHEGHTFNNLYNL
jgi:hypothetical protein